jgi:PAS domain S-box-containing protein
MSEVKKRSEEKQETGEGIYKTIFENLPFVAFTLDRKGRILEANKYAEEVTGLELKDVKDKGFAEIVSLGKKDLIKAFIEFRKNLQGKVTGKTAYHVKLKDGGEILLELIGIPLKEKGKVTKVLDVGRDVSREKETEDEIKRSEAKFKAIFENAGGAIFLADAETGEVLDCNLKAERLIGRSKREIVGMHQSQLHPEGEGGKYRKKFASHVKRGHLADYEGEVHHRDGRRIPVWISAQIIEIGEEKIALGLFIDVTERKKAEEELRSREEQFRKLFKEMPDAVIILDRKGKFLEASDEAEKLSGYKKSEVVGNNLFMMDILDVKTKAVIIKKLAFHFSGGKVPPFEVEIKRKDGRVIPLEVNAQIIDYMGKKADMVILRDITKRKEEKEALKMRTEELERFSKLSVGRELRMVELKNRIKELKERLGEKG